MDEIVGQIPSVLATENQPSAVQTSSINIPKSPAASTISPLILSLIVVVVFLCAGVVYFGYQNYQLQNRLTVLEADRKPSIENEQLDAKEMPSDTVISSGSMPEGAVAVDQTSTFTNTPLQFSIDYPKGWRFIEEQTFTGFGPQEVGEDVLLGVSYYSILNKTEENLKAEIGFQFSDRQQEEKPITVNGTQGLLITTTTPSIPSWRSEDVMIVSGPTIFVISNGAISDAERQNTSGVPKTFTFKKFYESFRLLNKPQ